MQQTEHKWSTVFVVETILRRQLKIGLLNRAVEWLFADDSVDWNTLNCRG